MTPSCWTFEGKAKKKEERWKGRVERIIRTNYSDGCVEQVELIAGTRPHGVLVTMRLWDRGPHLEPHAQGVENKRGLTRDGKSAGVR